MRKKYTVLFAGLMLSFVMLTGCGSNIPPASVSDDGMTEREKELQAEVDALQQELDEIKQGQNQQDTQAADDSTGTTDNSQASKESGNAGKTAEVVQVPMEEARQIALDRVPGATEDNISIKLEVDDGWYIYEGDILYNRMEYEFEIDANTGDVLKWEQEKW